MSLPFVGRRADGASVCTLDAVRRRYVVSSPTANYERGMCLCATAIILVVSCNKYLKVQF